MELIHELLGYKNIKIIQKKDTFCFSVDSMLLANFIKPTTKTKRIIDLGCGNAPIPLFLSMKTKAKIIGVEIQEDIADLAQRSVALNNLEDQITIINADLRNIYRQNFANQFDIVLSNPPYFKYKPNNHINKNEYLTIARHEIKASLEDIIVEAVKLLVDGGSLYLVHRAERLEEIIAILKKTKFSIKNLQFVYPKVKATEALLVLLEARKNGNSGLKIMQPMYIYQENDQYTEEVMKIFNFNKPE